VCVYLQVLQASDNHTQILTGGEAGGLGAWVRKVVLGCGGVGVWGVGEQRVEGKNDLLQICRGAVTPRFKIASEIPAIFG
jgi:hypothetical protein